MEKLKQQEEGNLIIEDKLGEEKTAERSVKRAFERYFNDY